MLESISKIKTFNDTELDAYLRSNPNIDVDYFRQALSYRHEDWAEIPASDFVIEYFIAYAKETGAIPTFMADGIDFTSDHLSMVSWDSGGTRYFITITQEKVDFISQQMEMSFAYDSDHRLIAELEADPEFADHQIFLSHLKLTTGSSYLIAPNPKSILVKEDTMRFSSAIWFEEIQKKDVLLAGIGGIGSFVSFLLSRVKPQSIMMYDGDKVDNSNMAGQLFSQNDIGRTKVDAACYMQRAYSNYYQSNAIPFNITSETEASDIMICGFDNMEARKIFFNLWVNHVNNKKNDEERKKCLFIDGRLNAEELQVLCIQGNDNYNMSKYENNFLFSDDEADETVCSYKQTSYMANMIGSIVTNLFVNFVANQVVEGIRELPFLTEYQGDSMTLKTEL